MRKEARKILFEELKRSGWQWVVFNEEEPNRDNGIVKSILDAMIKYKKTNKSKKHCSYCSGTGWEIPFDVGCKNCKGTGKIKI